MVETVYFLESGICSIVVTMEDGSSVEVGIVGRESYVGMPAVLGTGHSPQRSFIQVAGSGYSIKSKILMEQSKDGSGRLHEFLERGIQAQHAQAAQSAACNRMHRLEERLARWLLMCRDRVGGDDLHMTHEFLAVMLGTRRSSVTIAAGMLQKAGLIEYSRGVVRMRNIKGLGKAACECYSVIRGEYVRLGLV